MLLHIFLILWKIMEEIKIEHWTSDQGEREDHYYIVGDKKVYLFGINPDIIDGADLAAIKFLIFSYLK